MKKSSRYIYIAAILWAAALPATAQEDNGTYNESVIVRGSFRPTIEQATKINFPTQITDTLSKMEHAFNYGISPTRMKSVYEPSRIKAARIVGEPTTKLYNNYLRVGFGNYWTPLLNAYWNSTRDKKKAYGMRVNHLSSWGSIPEYRPIDQNNTSATAFGKYIINKKLQLSSDISYEHDHNLYYGFTDSLLADRSLGSLTRDSISTADYRASYNIAQANISLHNMELDPNKLGYSARIHAEDLWATYGRNEFGLAFGGDIHYGFEIANRYRAIAFLEVEWQHYADSRKMEEDFPLYYVTNLILPITDTIKHSRNIIRISPYADFMIGGLQFRTGMTAAWDGFSTDTMRLHIYPDVTVCKKLFNDNLVLTLGATGGLTANTWNAIRIINPYIEPDAEQQATSHYNFTAQARWTLSRKLEANLEAKYQIIDNDLFFHMCPAYALNNVFSPVFIDDNMFSIGGAITFVNDEMLTLRAGGHYYNCTLRDTTLGTVATYRPDWDANISATLNYNDRWLFGLETCLLGKMKAEDNTVMPMRYGVRAEIEYRHNRALSAFMRVDNLAFQRYYLWQNYPSQRALLILGLTYTIPHK